MKKKWVTIFERYEDFHYVKDVGQIPYHAQEVLAYEVELWRKSNESSSVIKNRLKIVNVECENGGVKLSYKLILRIIKESKHIDVLQLFHFRSYTLIYAYLYKIFNKNGKVIIKCDGSDGLMPFNNGGILKRIMLKAILSKIDIVSAEHLSIVKFLAQNKLTSFYMPNGVCSDFYHLAKNFPTEKQSEVPTIIFVGKCGDPRKNAEQAIRALACLPEKLKWRALFLGGETEEFKCFFDKFCEAHESLKDKIEFKGFISDTTEVSFLYHESHIFLMTSLHEGYPISLAEACWLGCMPVLSVNSGGNDLVANSAGYVFQSDDELTNIIRQSIINLAETISAGEKCQNYVHEHNDWRKNLCKLDGQL
jgi:glycosyltransferase involved in cell wall biosynthesis